MDLDFVSVHKHAKKERGQYPAILIEQAWSIKDLLYGIKHQNTIKFSLRVTARLPRGSHSQGEIRFILLAHGAIHIITVVFAGVVAPLLLRSKNKAENEYMY